MVVTSSDRGPGAPEAKGELSRGARRRRTAEFALFFLGVPVLLRYALSPGNLIPVLWILAGAAGIALRLDPLFDRRLLVTWSGWDRERRRMLLRILACAAGMAGTLWWHRPELLFRFPREKPGVWALVVLLYPLLSAYPQGVIFRSLYQHRYAPLFRSRLVAHGAGALVFSIAHLPFGNAWAMGFTLLGGLMFLQTYKRTHSLPISCLEHALLGNLLFTIGWGAYLYHGGTQALLAGRGG